jgi:asparagine synthase (glutamine-hydrolysing)
MCGICGFIGKKDNMSFDCGDLLIRMTESLIHRGPDATGHAILGTEDTVVGFGHRRLSIIDITQNANQPLGNEDGTIIVVYNGEIYNYSELRKELVVQGHDFKSQSDTEVIVHLYEEHGDECLNHLDGMFAFALLDKKKNTVLLARDRLGIKQLFY